MQGKSRCFVTGATGFIGSHLVRQLNERGHSVRCLVRSDSQVNALADLGAECRLGNMSDQEVLRNAVSHCEFVFHLAGVTKSVGGQDFQRTNVDGAMAIAKACASQSNPPTLIYVSSLAALGPARNGRALNEQSNPQPVSMYGRSKLAAEQALRGMGRNVPLTIIRPPIVLGERDFNGLELFRSVASLGIHCVPTFRQHHVSLIHVEDLMAAVLITAERGERLGSDDPSQGVYHVAAERDPTYAELGRMIGRAVGRRRVFVLPIATPVLKAVAGMNELTSRITGKPAVLNWDKSREAAVGPWTTSADKIASQLDFRVAQPLQERLNQTARWYAENGHFQLKG
jgi:nucleoside-diphosphate-sugar epimerase